MATRLHEAKHPVTRLAGPYGHPFHPVLVTVPIGAWVASLVFDLAALAADEEATFAEGAYWLIVLGVVLSVIALVVLGASGWLGGKLSYTYGVRVAAERTQRDGYV